MKSNEEDFELWWNKVNPHLYESEQLEMLVKASCHRAWSAASNRACRLVDGYWCCSKDLKLQILTGEATCTK